MLHRNDLHPYQNDTVSFIKEKRRCGLWLDMGMGKTIITLTALSDLIYGFTVRRVLIISPLRVAKSVWEQEARRWEHTKDLVFSICCGTQKQRLEKLKVTADVYIINNENVKWLIDVLGKEDWIFDCMVVDESSCFKNPSSKRFKCLKKILFCMTYRIILTGTPAPNSYLDLWSQTFLIDEGDRLGKTITSYRQCYFESDRWGYNYTLAEGCDVKIKDKVSDIYLSLKLNDYFPDINSLFIKKTVTIPPSIFKKYTTFKNTLLMEMDSGDPITAVSAGVLAGKLLQFSNGAIYDEGAKTYTVLHNEKIKRLEELVNDNPCENFLVAYNFKSDKDRLLEAFPFAKTLDAENAVQYWNDGKIKMLLAHPASSGHGLNLQHGGRVIVWFGLCWSLELYRQLNARLARQGQTDVVKFVHLISEGTIDERVMEVLQNKDANQNWLLNALNVHRNER